MHFFFAVNYLGWASASLDGQPKVLLLLHMHEAAHAYMKL